MSNKAPQELSERDQALLKALVQQYILDGQPVGSKTLAQTANLKVSSATIRNVMADLEDCGLVSSPHTSAGRVPTNQGFRFFVDSLLTMEGVNKNKIKDMQQTLNAVQDPQVMVASASEMLSGLTRLAGVVMVPRPQRTALRHVEFLSLSDSRVLAILVTNEQEVHNRVIELNREYSEGELQQVANYLNEKFSGADISTVRQSIIDEMQRAQENMNNLMSRAVEMAEKVFDNKAGREDSVVMAGETNLMQFEELSDIDNLRNLFAAFNQKQEIIHLLDQCLHNDGIQIYIGDESGYQVLGDCSVVTAPYSVDNQVVGVLGVIGPTRMSYDKVIPIVDITAKVLGAALNSRT